ncbi:hypothetical protein [Ciceribacter thiooxidans]|uniref:Uncharacterized protein n=1 Tax=Ciceribacter thiooxidans TaxID=1969821 RepID=A0ABV7I0E6_9HYPH|nr:hypothetical protein [Ciceribacter thiooxidans]
MKHRRGIDLAPEASAVPAVERRFFESRGGGPNPGAAYVLPQHVDIAAICRACGHTTELSRAALKEAGLETKPFDTYEHRLTCTVCGKRDARIALGECRQG